MRRHRLDQWQDAYPNEESVLLDIDRGEGYVMTYGGQVAAYFCLSSRPETAYASITDGKWRAEGPYCVIHRSAVEASFRGTGMADKMMAAAEELTRAMGIGDLRVDTHRHNESMKALLKRCGFQYRGNVLVQVAEGHDPRRQAFEKVLK